MTPHLHVRIDDHILRLILARAEKKNAISNEMYAAMTEALVRAETDSDVRVVLFEAEGDTFCAGNDLAEFAAVAAGTSLRSRLCRGRRSALDTVRESRPRA